MFSLCPEIINAIPSWKGHAKELRGNRQKILYGLPELYECYLSRVEVPCLPEPG